MKSFGYLDEDPFPSVLSVEGKRSLSRSKSDYDIGMSRTKVDPRVDDMAGMDLLFSPFASYFAEGNQHATRKGGKVMIGDNGWLERTSSTPGRKAKDSPKKAGILSSIKKIAKDMVRPPSEDQMSSLIDPMSRQQK
jgi:hypothetical protein